MSFKFISTLALGYLQQSKSNSPSYAKQPPIPAFSHLMESLSTGHLSKQCRVILPSSFSPIANSWWHTLSFSWICYLSTPIYMKILCHIYAVIFIKFIKPKYNILIYYFVFFTSIFSIDDLNTAIWHSEKNKHLQQTQSRVPVALMEMVKEFF